MDLQRTFDTVDHEVLCKKLNAIGIRNIDWFKSYLAKRIQFVQLENTLSNPGAVKCGVPQVVFYAPFHF